MAAATASPTRPGLDCQVPNPTEGILDPVFNWKKRISSAISRFLRRSSDVEWSSEQPLGALFIFLLEGGGGGNWN